MPSLARRSSAVMGSVVMTKAPFQSLCGPDPISQTVFLRSQLNPCGPFVLHRAHVVECRVASGRVVAVAATAGPNRHRDIRRLLVRRSPPGRGSVERYEAPPDIFL